MQVVVCACGFTISVLLVTRILLAKSEFGRLELPYYPVRDDTASSCDGKSIFWHLTSYMVDSPLHYLFS